MNAKPSLFIWIAIAIALVVLFNFYPSAAKVIPNWLTIPVIVVGMGSPILAARRRGTLPEDLNTTAFGIAAKHLMIAGVALVCAAFVWMSVILHLVQHPISSDELLLIVIVPTMLLVLAGMICLGYGFFRAFLRQH